VDGRAGIEALRRNVGDISVRRSANDDTTSAFCRTAFDPVDVLVIERDFAERDRSGNQKVCGDRRLPGAVWFDLFHLSPESTTDWRIQLIDTDP
jgi:hypothetical protein